MTLKSDNKIKGDWKKADSKDIQKYQNMSSTKKEKIDGVEKDIMIDSVEPLFREDGSIHGYKTKSHFV